MDLIYLKFVAMECKINERHLSANPQRSYFLQTTVTCTQHLSWLDICKRSMMEFAKCVMFLHDEKMKTTRDQVTTQSNIPVSNFVLLNSVDSLTLQFEGYYC